MFGSETFIERIAEDAMVPRVRVRSAAEAVGVSLTWFTSFRKIGAIQPWTTVLPEWRYGDAPPGAHVT